MNQSHRRLLACAILIGITLTTVGCSQKRGASFEARLLTKNSSGDLEKSVTSSHSHFAVDGKGSFDFTDSTLGWEVKAIESDKVTVSVTYAGSDPQEVQIDVGKSEDVLFNDGSIGVRILIHGIKVK
jgi:hypothetical protein